MFVSTVKSPDAVARAANPEEMIRDLMVSAVERGLGSQKVPHAVEWVSDNGIAHVAAETDRGACPDVFAKPRGQAA